MNRFQFQTVPNIIAGLGTIQELFKILINGRYRRLLLVTDPGMLKQQSHLPVLDVIEYAGLEYVIYSGVQADAPDTAVLEAGTFAMQDKIDVVLCFGGVCSLRLTK